MSNHYDKICIAIDKAVNSPHTKRSSVSLLAQEKTRSGGCEYQISLGNLGEYKSNGTLCDVNLQISQNEISSIYFKLAVIFDKQKQNKRDVVYKSLEEEKINE